MASESQKPILRSPPKRKTRAQAKATVYNAKTEQTGQEIMANEVVKLRKRTTKTSKMVEKLEPLIPAKSPENTDEEADERGKTAVPMSKLRKRDTFSDQPEIHKHSVETRGSLNAKEDTENNRNLRRHSLGKPSVDDSEGTTIMRKGRTRKIETSKNVESSETQQETEKNLSEETNQKSTRTRKASERSGAAKSQSASENPLADASEDTTALRRGRTRKVDTSEQPEKGTAKSLSEETNRKPTRTRKPSESKNANTSSDKSVENAEESKSTGRNLRTRKADTSSSSTTQEQAPTDMPKHPLKETTKNLDDEKTMDVVRKPRERKPLKRPAPEVSMHVQEKSTKNVTDKPQKGKIRIEQASKSPAGDISNKRYKIVPIQCSNENETSAHHSVSSGKDKPNIKIFEKINLKKLVTTIKAMPAIDLQNKNNNNECISLSLNPKDESQMLNDLKHNDHLLEALCDALTSPPEKQPDTGYTHIDLVQFLQNSSIKDMFPFVAQTKHTTELFKRIISDIYALVSVQLDQMLDLYHLGIIMQTYQQLETHMGYRHELLDAVGELSLGLQPEDIEYIGISLCDRFVMGYGIRRVEKIIDMHSALVILINHSDINMKIAMMTLLATFGKVSSINLPDENNDIINKAFEMAKSVNWLQLVESGRLDDLFVLVRCFSLIINTHNNRSVHQDWHNGMGSDIHKFFMTVLRTVRFSKNYNFFAMMVERYIAFCVVQGATPRAHTMM